MEENTKEKTENKKHILVNKKIFFMNRFTSNNLNHHKNKSINNSNKEKINTVDSIKSQKNRLANLNINNYQFEIKEKDIIFKNNGNENNKLLGKILSEFNKNNNENSNNIFDENIKNDILNTQDKKDTKLKKENRIQEIEIKNMNLNSNFKINKNKSSSEFKNKKQLYELDLKDRNYEINNLNTEINFNNDIINSNNNLSSNINYLNTETFVESVRNRNRPKNISLNNFSYNELFNKSNTYKDFHKTPKNLNRINNNINNINNINNNISLNNRYNFYIKIGKTIGNEQQKDNNKNINCEIKLNKHNIKNKDEISSRIIKKLIKNYEIDNINNKALKKEINVTTKPSFKKLEVQKVLYKNNNNFKESRNKKNKIIINNKIQKSKNNTNYSFNKTNFKLLVHQAYENRNYRASFNKYFKSTAFNKGRSLSNRNNNSNSSNNTNLINNTETDLEIDPFYKQNKCNKKFKSFYNISLTKRNNKQSEKKILNKCNVKSIDIINYNRNINNIKLKKNKISKNLNDINNNKNYSQTQRIIYNFDINANNDGNKTSNREGHHSKVNSSFNTFTINSNFNSITNLTNTNINTNRYLSPTSTKSISFSTYSINLEFLYVLQEKLKLVLENLKKSKTCYKASFDFINYYFNHNFSNEIINLMISSDSQNIIIKFIKIELLCFFLLYDISFEEEIKEIEIILKSIFSLLYKNFLITILFVTSKYKNENNNIILILNKIVKDNLQNDDLFETYKILDESKYIKIVENHFHKILDYYGMIVENIYMKKIDENNKITFNECINNINPKILSKNKFENIICNFFIEAQKKLSDYSIETLKRFFDSFLNSKETFYKNIKSKNKTNSMNNSFHYLLPKIREHKYTLILDLDETLIYSQINFDYKLNKKILLPKTTLIMRPGLHEFLHDMKLLYELIIFSSGSPEYVDPIIKEIEKDEKYFDYILYRDHMIVDEFGDNVKDLNLIGRNLNSVIIIDDVSKNFKMQKDNGICIRPFVGNCSTDSKILKTLNNVLQKIRFNADDTNDIRISLKKFKYLLYPTVISEIQ